MKLSSLQQQMIGVMMVIALLVGCNAPAAAPALPSDIPTPLPTTATPTPLPPTNAASTDLPPSNPTEQATTVPVSISFPLSEPGPYFAGNRAYTLVDESRQRTINLTIWYPALEQADAPGKRFEAPPDMSGAPYPLILIEPNSGEIFSSHLASHGFAMAIIRFPDQYENWDLGVVDHPRDMLFALDQIASNPPEGLEGVIDSDHAGVTGYSWGGFYALALSGVRIDPSAYLEFCKQASTMQPPLSPEYQRYTCSLAANWDLFSAHVGDEIKAGEDGLWQPMTDERIRAVMPMAADGAWLYGERGLAAADRPVFMIQGSNDEFTLIDGKFIFEHLKTPELGMVSFIGKQHMMVFDAEPAAQMKHFATAYFGYHLQGRADYADYFSEEFVGQFEDLAWGFYEGE